MFVGFLYRRVSARARHGSRLGGNKGGISSSKIQWLQGCRFVGIVLLRLAGFGVSPSEGWCTKRAWARHETKAQAAMAKLLRSPGSPFHKPNSSPTLHPEPQHQNPNLPVMVPVMPSPSKASSQTPPSLNHQNPIKS